LVWTSAQKPQPLIWLARTTREALSQLRTLGRRKESYIGPWLPEPLLTPPL
jgi:RNA polymerase sigma-70 factor (ECF subfamily)